MIQYNNLGGGGGMSLSLTTIGNTGPSTLIGNVLNIPVYGIGTFDQVLAAGNSATQKTALIFDGLFRVSNPLNNSEISIIGTNNIDGTYLQFNSGSGGSFNILLDDVTTTLASFLRLPSYSGTHYLPLSVNGAFADNTGNISINVAGQPAAPDTSIQFNNNGVFGGSSNFTWDYNTDIAAITGRLTSIYTEAGNSTTNGQFFQTVRTITGIASGANSYGFTTSYYIDLNSGHINGSELYNFASIFAGTTLNGNDGIATTQPIRSVEASLTILANPVLIDDFRYLDVKKGDHSASFGTSFITNCYGLKLADQFNATGFSITNSWGIYQEGSNDNNYFAGKLGIQGLPTARVLYVNDAMEFGAAAISATFGTSSGDYLIVWVNGNEYRIDLLNPN